MSIKKVFLNISIILLTGLTYLTSAQANMENQLSIGSTQSATINSADFQRFYFNSGDTPPHFLEISSFLAMGGLGAAFNGNALVYPVIIIKDTSGKTVSRRLISQNAIRPGWTSALHLETKWQIRLAPGKNYILLVKAGNPTRIAETSYESHISAGNIHMPTTVNARLSPAASGNIEIRLN